MAGKTGLKPNRAGWLDSPSRAKKNFQNSNRLSVLANEIRQAHADSAGALARSVGYARAAGAGLIEAKSLVPSKGWLAWLESIDFNDRTARYYMQLARAPEGKVATVADLGIRGAIETLRDQPSRKDPPAARGQPDRDGPDFWPTPDSLIAAARDHVLPHLPTGVIWECACGDGRLGRAIDAEIMTDKYPQDGSPPHNFLVDDPPAPGLIAFTNQPFNAADEFLVRGLNLLDCGIIRGLVLLLRHDHFMASGKVDALNRATIEVHCNWRPTWIPETEGNPRWAFAWVYWGEGERQPPLYVREGQ